jgi:plastocyanin
MTVARWIVLVGTLGFTISVAPVTVTIAIVANNGALSFAPNPATAVSGDSLVWRNNDFTVHHIVLDDGSLDTGDIIPGASSAPMALTGAGGGYHCIIHPSMVGTINGPCTFTLAPTSASVPSTASSASVSVTAASGCAWTAVSNDGFITITSGASGSGNGTVSYAVAANTTTAARTGSLTIAGQTFTITQAAPAPCTFTLAPTSASVPSTASSASVSVTAASGCAWTAVSSSGFLTVTSGASGSGNGTVGYNVAANTTTSARSGSITIAGQTFTVTQAATVPTCPTIVLAPSTLPNVTQGVAANLPLTASGGTAPYVFAVTAGSVPAGLTLSSAGVLSGTPTTAGSSTFTVRATDAGGCFVESGYSLTVLAAVPTMPRAFMLLLAAGLIGLGWWRLARRRAGA